MAALEQDILEQIKKLSEPDQRRVLEFARSFTSASNEKPPSLIEWLVKAEESQTKLAIKYGEDHFFNTQAILDELREEASEWPRG